jgi:hypothetical protein
MSLPVDVSWWTIAALLASLLAVVPITLVLRIVPRMRSRDSSLLGLRDELPYRPQIDANARLTYVGDQKTCDTNADMLHSIIANVTVGESSQ